MVMESHNGVPMRRCTLPSTIMLCDIRHMSASMLTSRRFNPSELIIAIGAYSGRKSEEMNTIELLPYNPRCTKNGYR